MYRSYNYLSQGPLSLGKNNNYNLGDQLIYLKKNLSNCDIHDLKSVVISCVLRILAS